MILENHGNSTIICRNPIFKKHHLACSYLAVFPFFIVIVITLFSLYLRQRRDPLTKSIGVVLHQATLSLQGVYTAKPRQIL